jgi:hypothetical protein
MAETRRCGTLLLYGRKNDHIHQWDMASDLRGVYVAESR